MQTAALALVLAVCVSVPVAEAVVETSDVPIDMARCYGYFKKKTNLRRTPAASIQHTCDNMYSWLHAKEMNINRRAGPDTIAYVRRLFENTRQQIHKHHIGKRQAEAGVGVGVGKKPKLRLRKELRMMTEAEIKNYFDAVNSAKRNTTISPNKYDALAEFHTGITSVSAHGGCNFHGWHRMYILMYENALREEGPEFADVTVPYWDARIEERMGTEAVKSALFSERLMGTCQGPVKGGIMGPEGWDSTATGIITRNCGTDGPLLNDEMIYNVTRRTRLGEICGDDSDIEDDLEYHHNGVHRWIDGQMAMLQSAVYDPIFWLLHNFIDLVWESFRENQKRAGVDRETDYPPNPTTMGAHELHLQDAEMGFADLKVIDGLSDMFTSEWYQFAPPPSCTPQHRDCGSKYLKCVITPVQPGRDVARCVGRTLDEVEEYEKELEKPVIPECKHEKPPIVVVNKTKTDTVSTITEVLKPVQNTFCMNGKSDIGQWVYIPVKIIFRRPPDYKSKGSYPVSRGKLQTQNDIYAPGAYVNNPQVYKRLRNSDHPATYENCLEPDVPTNTIYVKSMGLNYEGVYKEYAIIDRRLAVTVATAYIAIRKPVSPDDVSVAMLHAQDSCGRVCKPICKVPGTEIFRPCSGAVRVTGGFPQQFGNSFGDAVLQVWDFNQDEACPQLSVNAIIVSFYCDHKTDWMWPSVEPVKHASNIVKEKAPPVLGNQMAPAPPTLPQAPPVPIKATTPAIKTTIKPGCAISYRCTVAKPCEDLHNCNDGDIISCIGSCHMFGKCLNGRFMMHACSRGYTVENGRCVRGRCNYRKSGVMNTALPNFGGGGGRGRGRNKFRGRRTVDVEVAQPIV